MARDAGHPGPFAVKTIEQCRQDADESKLKRAVGTLDLTALGIGAVIGTGIFVIIGEAIGDSGPAIVLSFLVAGITCMFSALSYAELAGAIPVSGSAYTYTYATMGELIAFIIGWDLILEYGVSVAAIAVGWAGYLNALLDSLFSIEIPKELANPPGTSSLGGRRLESAGSFCRRVVRSTRQASNSLMRNTLQAAPCSAMSMVVAGTGRYRLRDR